MYTEEERRLARRESQRKYRAAHPGHWRGRDPEKARDAQRRYHQRHPDVRERQRAERRELLDALKAVPCSDCGGTFPPECMDFDHRPGEVKAFNLGQSSRSPDTLRTEAAKCDVVCANCHRIRTRRRGMRYD